MGTFNDPCNVLGILLLTHGRTSNNNQLVFICIYYFMTWENRVKQMARMGDLDSQYEKDDRKPPCCHHDTIYKHSCRCHFPTSGMFGWLYHVYRLYIYICRLYFRSYILFTILYIYIYILCIYISSDPPRHVYIYITTSDLDLSGEKFSAISSQETVQYCGDIETSYHLVMTNIAMENQHV